MEDDKKSGLQISLGDFVSFPPLFCCISRSQVIFLGVRRLAGPQLLHRNFDDDDGPFVSKMK